MTNYAFISDVHSNAKSLSSALDYCAESNLTPIFLGDLFDPKDIEYDTIGTYNLVKQAEKFLGATILQSNHQNKLIRYLQGNNVVLNYGLDCTINDFFETNSFDRDELRTWLESFPYGIALRDASGTEYRAAHAYFPLSLHVGPYSGLWSIHEVSKKDQNKMLYGIFKCRDRLEWWLDATRSKNWVRVAGHYHHIHMDNQSLVLDGCSGEKDGSLLVYNINNKFLHFF